MPSDEALRRPLPGLCPSRAPFLRRALRAALWRPGIQAPDRVSESPALSLFSLSMAAPQGFWTMPLAR